MCSDKQGNQFSVSEPMGHILLLNRPTFRWFQLDGATGYVVEVYDEKFNPIAASPQVAGNSWTVTQPLKRGGICSRQVKAIKNGQEFTSPYRPALQAKFRALDRAKANKLTRVLI